LLTYFLGEVEMSSQITEAFRREYSDNFELIYQQKESMIGNTVRREDQNAEMKFWDYLGETGVEWDGPRHGDTPQIDTPHTRRKNTLHTARWADKIDKPDKVQTLKDPQSGYIRVGTSAMRRAEDERVIEALGETAYTGKDGNTPVTLVSESYRIMGDGTVKAPGEATTDTVETGLTLEKIAQAGAILDENNVPESDRHIVANSDQKWFLLGSPSPRFTVNATDAGCFECYAYHREAVVLGIGYDLTTEVDRLPTKNYSVQVFAEMMIGGTRLQGEGVVQMLLKKVPGTDFTQA
jgi:hypothetical protein